MVLDTNKEVETITFVMRDAKGLPVVVPVE